MLLGRAAGLRAVSNSLTLPSIASSVHPHQRLDLFSRLSGSALFTAAAPAAPQEHCGTQPSAELAHAGFPHAQGPSPVAAGAAIPTACLRTRIHWRAQLPETRNFSSHSNGGTAALPAAALPEASQPEGDVSSTLEEPQQPQLQSQPRQEVFSEADRASRRHVRFIDRMRLSATAGHGGKGSVSFWKSTSKGA